MNGKSECTFASDEPNNGWEEKEIKINKKIFYLVIVLLFYYPFFTLCQLPTIVKPEKTGYNAGQNEWESCYNANNSKTGNSTGNIINGGFIAEQGDWLYFYDYFKQHCGLYKLKKNGTTRIKLCNDSPQYINVIGDWVYYKNENNCKFYKIKTNGTQRTKVSSAQMSSINVVDGWIYYHNLDDNFLYKIKTDGTGRIKLGIDNVGVINVLNDEIYYINKSDDDKIYRINIDGLNKVKITDDKSGLFIVTEDWIYYANKRMSGILYKIKTNGTERVSLVTSDFVFFNVLDNWIVYSGFFDNSQGLHRILADDAASIDDFIIKEFSAKQINVIDDWIYYQKWINYKHSKYVSPELYRVKVDGTCKQLISELE